jgi:hypothetical protein
LPEDVRAEDVFAPAPMTEPGWFVGRMPAARTPLWFVVPGYEPIGFVATDDDTMFIPPIPLTPLKQSGELSVHVLAVSADVSVTVSPKPCGEQAAGSMTRSGRDVTFRKLPLVPWHVVARAPWSTTAELDVSPVSGNTDVTMTLESARNVSVEMISQGDCKREPERRDLVPGELVVPGLRLVQRNQRLSLSSDNLLGGGYVGSGVMAQYCSAPTVKTAFQNQELRSGDVYLVRDHDRVVLMRFTVQ